MHFVTCGIALHQLPLAQAIENRRQISDQTVRNRLHAIGLRARRPVRGPVLTRRHREARLPWSRNRIHWTVHHHWRRVVFSDESHFLLQRHDRRRRVYRRRNEHFAQNCIDEAPPHGGGGVMVWGTIHFYGRSPLIHVQGRLNAQRYISEIFEPQALPLLDDATQIFMQNNARPHSARLTMDYLNRNNITILPWPPISPDLNPIGHLWGELDRRVRRRVIAPSNVRELFQALQEEWNNIPMQYIGDLLRSMPRRLQSVIGAEGGHNTY